MRSSRTAGLALMAFAGLAWSSRAADPPAHPGDCGGSQVIFRMESEETKITVPIKVKNQPLVKERVFLQDVPCTKLIPVASIDPATGQKITEYKEVPAVKQVTILMVDVIHPCEEWSCRGEERVKKCVHVHMSKAPRCGGDAP